MRKSVRVARFLTVKSIARGNVRVLALTIVMLILVYLNLIFTPAILEGLVDNVNDKVINTLAGDITVQSDASQPAIDDVSALVSGIESLDGVVAASARNNLGADMTYQGERITTVVYAIDPEQDKEVFRISEDLIEGSYLDAEDTGQILLGLQVAGADREDLELYSSSLRSVHAGDTVTVRYVNGMEKQYTVKGIFYCELIQTDIRTFITEKEFNSLNPLMADKASAIHVKTEKDVELEPIIAQIAGIREGLKFQTWEDIAGVLRSMTVSMNQIIVILQIVALIVAAITVFIVTYVDLANKRRQIGIERAIGITPSAIVLSYVFRAVVYAVIGILAAALIFVYVVVPLEARHPFHFPFGDVFLPVNISYLIRSALILCGVAVVSAFVPSFNTIRVKIIDAIWSS
ncbi:MAG: FtsX-like permease family protein [Chloroflexi bacterium]|nr:FtsX-like permease family protein [Chloroflexota bacterium]